ncbi:MAG: hypothetical protein K6F16_04000 [Lachnospiraceae bacterium]|nr:hypothetical protein [Lachnospiraceae bacterium]
MKRITTLALTALLCGSILLAGCSGSAADDSAVSDGTSVPTDAVVTELPADNPSDTTDPVTDVPVDPEVKTPGSAVEPVNYVYGTASLTYAEFYSGDVSETEGFDAVTSATTKKYQILQNMYTDFVDEETNPDGYHILGVKDVAVAVPENEVEAFTAINPTFVLTGSEAPAQFKTVSVSDGKAFYSATAFNIADVVTDATYSLATNSNWGDYLVCVYDGEKIHLRNTREDEFDINSAIQGIIVETKYGLKVGLEALQSIWVQPYEFSFNISPESTNNSHITGWDNLSELAKLEGDSITKVYYIMQDRTYEYDFDGIFVKPFYSVKSYNAVRTDNILTLETADFGAFENVRLKVTYTVGAGRNAERTVLFDDALTSDTVTLDLAGVEAAENKAGSFTGVISSDNYADVAVIINASEEQNAALAAMIEQAKTVLAGNPANADALSAQIAAAEAVLADGHSSADTANAANRLNSLIEAASGSGEGGQHH